MSGAGAPAPGGAGWHTALELTREGVRHRPGGAWWVLITVGSVIAALYVLWIGALAVISGDAALWLARRTGSPAGLEAFATWARAFTARFHLDISVFIAITFPIAFLTTTARQSRKTLAWTDIALALIAFAVAMYYIVENDRFLNWSRGFSRPTTLDYTAGFTLIVLVVELCRRSTGPGLTALILILLAYSFWGHLLPGALKHENYTHRYFIEMLTVQENGIFGAPLEVAASYAFLFVLFGSFFERSGGGQLFFDLASAITGRMRGGAAKACVTASGLYGSVSGSPTADVATTGPLTIPIMKRQGIPAARAGAIEAAASSGGAMLPPVMGAVAFIMSDITGIPYVDIAWASLLPAILYYVAIYILVHNEAVRNDEGRMPDDQIVDLMTALARGWRHLLPLAALIVLLLLGYTPTYVAAGSTAAVIVLSWLSPRDAIGPRRFVVCCVDTITQLVPLVGAVAGAGIVIGCIEVSGLAGKFTLLITYLSGGYLPSTLIFAALFLVLLGMGMPTPAVYIMGAALLGPTLLQKFGLPVLPAHLFLLYYACLSAVTPPVAVANFAAGAIAGANPMALGPHAVKLAIGGFVVPFFFLFNHGILLRGSVVTIVSDIVAGVVLVACASLVLHGWWGKARIPWPVRGGLAVAALAILNPEPTIQWPAALAGVLVMLGLWKFLSPPAAVPSQV
ncbi:MAG: TRAP transporter fused permease subunit [Alphaproteobacteria bacterium]|nr:TRAP transporter fused permease subunit [Alphaproteobacteria bacterium]